MGLLFYNNSPNEQFLKNSSFEEPLLTLKGDGNWFATGNVTRQSDVIAFGEFAAKLDGTSSISQEGTYLAKIGQVTISILARGKEGTLSLTYELLDNLGITVFSITKTLKVPSDSDFNNLYILASIPSNITPVLGRVTYAWVGTDATDSIYLDNGKLEQGNQPTRWSPAKGEASIDVPSDFSTTPAFVDPLDIYEELINLRATNSPAPAAGSGVGGASSVNSAGQRTTRDGVPILGQTVIGGDVSDSYSQYETFLKKYRSVIRKRSDRVVNRAEPRYFPDKKDLEFLKFKRDKLKETVNNMEGTSSSQAGWIQYSQTKIAVIDRAYQSRVHSRTDTYSFGFIESWIDYQYLREEDGCLKEFTGVEAGSRAVSGTGSIVGAVSGAGAGL